MGRGFILLLSDIKSWHDRLCKTDMFEPCFALPDRGVERHQRRCRSRRASGTNCGRNSSSERARHCGGASGRGANGSSHPAGHGSGGGGRLPPAAFHQAAATEAAANATAAMHNQKVVQAAAAAATATVLPTRPLPARPRTAAPGTPVGGLLEGTGGARERSKTPPGGHHNGIGC